MLRASPHLFAFGAARSGSDRGVSETRRSAKYLASDKVRSQMPLRSVFVVVAALALVSCGGANPTSPTSSTSPTPTDATYPLSSATRTTATNPPTAMTCSASVGAASTGAPTVSFDESQIAAIRTTTYAAGTYATCPMQYSGNLPSFGMSAATFSGNFTLRNLWNGCSSFRPEVWSGGVLQSYDSNLVIAIPGSAANVQFSVGVDGSAPDPRFDLTATTAAGETTTTQPPRSTASR